MNNKLSELTERIDEAHSRIDSLLPRVRRGEEVASVLGQHAREAAKRRKGIAAWWLFTVAMLYVVGIVASALIRVAATYPDLAMYLTFVIIGGVIASVCFLLWLKWVVDL